MKKLIFLFAFAMMAISINAQKSAIKTGPIALAFGFANVAYEYQFADNMSVLARGNYFYGGDILGAGVTGFSVGAGYRYYIKQKKNLAGFYLEPQVSYTSYSNGYDGSIGFGGVIGYQMRWDGGFVLDLGAGPYFTNGGFGPVITIAIGYAFGSDGGSSGRRR